MLVEYNEVLTICNQDNMIVHKPEITKEWSSLVDMWISGILVDYLDIIDYHGPKEILRNKHRFNKIFKTSIQYLNNDENIMLSTGIMIDQQKISDIEVLYEEWKKSCVQAKNELYTNLI
jgi:hypothetical protein